MLLTLLGGIGLFLLGMILMTDGLKALAGDSLRRILARFASNRVSGLATGAGLTVLVQSSHATTMATIGFVSSGLLTFQQALGVIFGANLGTTSTGWLVAVLGFKFSISSLAFAFVGAGALMKLLGRDRVATAGLVAAGFGLIFIGIDVLQDGMGALSERIDPSTLPSGGLGARFLLVLFGIVMTVVMQSSSAAMATTLTALHAGTISIDQAAGLVVGQNIGSAVTAAVAAIGASVPAKRTAAAHILFNIATGGVAFLLLPGFVAFADWISNSWAGGSDEIALAAFHTFFNVLGVALFLPFTAPFARAVTRLLPEKGPQLTQHLGTVTGRDPQVAIEATHTTLQEILVTQLRTVVALLSQGGPPPQRNSNEAARQALEETAAFLGRIPSAPESESVLRRRLAVMHALDHLDSLGSAMGEREHLVHLREDPELWGDVTELHAGLVVALDHITTGDKTAAAEKLAVLSREVAATRRTRRVAVLGNTAEGKASPEAALKNLDAIRWIDRLAYHLWRAGAHLYQGESVPAPPV